MRDARCEVRGKVVKLKYFALWRDSSLRCVSFRMTGFYFYSRLGICFSGRIIFWNAKIFLSSLCFKEAKLAKFIRYEAMWWRMKDEGCEVRDARCEYSITKFTEMCWKDGVFEGSEEHRRCSGKVTDIRLAGVEKLFPWWRDSSLRCALFRVTRLCFLLTIRNVLPRVKTQTIGPISYCYKKQIINIL